MLIYFFIPTYLFILSLINPKNKIIKDISFIITGIFLCTTYFNGSDWRAYEILYSKVSFNNIKEIYGEIGYHVYSLIFKSIGIDFWFFFIITKLLCFYIIYKKLNISKNNIYFLLMLFYSYFGLILFIDCPLRNLIAVCISLSAEKYLIRKKYFQYYLLVSLAFSFHNSALVMFFLPILKIEKWVKFNKYIIFFSVLVFNLIILNQSFIIEIIKFLPFNLENRILRYVGREWFNMTIFSIGNLEKLIIFFFIIFNKEKIFKYSKNIYSKWIISMLIIYYLFYRLSYTAVIFSRIMYYFIIYYILSINFIFELFKRGKNKMIILTLFFIHSLLMINQKVENTHKYIPYTSYLTYIFREKPDYKYRSEYNYKKFHERTEKRIGDY